MSTKELVAVRLEPAIVARIDALKDFFSSSWHDASRSEVLRALIVEALERFEKAHRASVASKKDESANRMPAASQKGAPRRKRKKPSGK